MFDIRPNKYEDTETVERIRKCLLCPDSLIKKKNLENLTLTEYRDGKRDRGNHSCKRKVIYFSSRIMSAHMTILYK